MGDAESLQFANNSFDTVINVESSHCYQQPEKFFTEAYRVLRPDGHFLFTDFRPKEAVESTRQQLQKVGFEIVKEENITANVFASMVLENQRKIEIIKTKVPKLFRLLANYFAAAEGTPMYEGLKNRELKYLCYVLKK